MNDWGKAAVLALDALVHMCHNTVAKKDYNGEQVQVAIDTLRAALQDDKPWTPDDTAHRPGGLPQTIAVFAFRRKGLDEFCTCSEHRYNELAQKPNLFEVRKFYTAPPQRPLLTDEEILKAVNWDVAEMYFKLTPNFPITDARKETIKNARAIERKVRGEEE